MKREEIIQIFIPERDRKDEFEELYHVQDIIKSDIKTIRVERLVLIKQMLEILHLIILEPFFLYNLLWHH